VNLLGDNIDTMKKSIGTLIDASKVVGLEINIEKTRFVVISSLEFRSKFGYKKWQTDHLKCVTIQINGNNSNKSKFDSGGK
jgi:hypothetical protein